MVLGVWKTIIKVASPTWTCGRFALVVGVTLFLASCHLRDNPPKTMSMAAFKGDKRAVLRFLNKGEDVNARGQDGERPIHFSVYGDQRAMVELLLVKGAGIDATNDIEVVKASDADVVIHTPLPSLIYGENPEQDLDDFCELLAAGKNVITIVGYMYPKVYGDAVVNRLEEACLAGNSSFHSTGLNPGWLGDLIPLTISSLCEKVEHVLVLEVSVFDGYASPEIMFDSMGFGATPDEFKEKNKRQKIWLDGLFSESVQMVADGMGLGVTEVVSSLETVLAETDLEVAAGTVKKGTVAGQHWRWSGLAN